MSLIEIIQTSDVGKAAAIVVDFVQNEIREFAKQRGLDPVVFFSDEKLKELSKELLGNDVQEVAMIDTKEYARQMRENCVKNEAGNIVCSPERWEQIASIIENAIIPPCKVGDKVYFVVEYDGKYFLDEGEVGSVYSDNGGIWISARYNSGLCYHHKANDDFGKTVFLTREEAEQALKERKNNEK